MAETLQQVEHAAAAPEVGRCERVPETVEGTRWWREAQLVAEIAHRAQHAPPVHPRPRATSEDQVTLLIPQNPVT